MSSGRVKPLVLATAPPRRVGPGDTLAPTRTLPPPRAPQRIEWSDDDEPTLYFERPEPRPPTPVPTAPVPTARLPLAPAPRPPRPTPSASMSAPPVVLPPATPFFPFPAATQRLPSASPLRGLPPWWAAVALLVVAAVGAAFALLLVPRTGRLVVHVANPEGATPLVDVFVDGKKRCDTAPCTVDTLAAGDHDVRVLANGFAPPPVARVHVPAHGDATIDVSLNREVAASPASPTGLRVGGTQPGAELFVDDRRIGALPQEVRDLSPGTHVVKLAGSDRYQPLTMQVVLEKGTIKDLGAVKLRVLKGKATILPGTPGARVSLVKGGDRRVLPVLPISISVDVDADNPWVLVASKPGFDDYKQSLSFDDGQVEKTYVVSLQPGGSRSATSAPAARWTGQVRSTPRASQPTDGDDDDANPDPDPDPPPPPPPASDDSSGDDSASAFLNINSVPPSTCFLDGRSLGSTPRANIHVSPGVHTVKFVNSELGLSKTITVRVRAGETRAAVTRLE